MDKHTHVMPDGTVIEHSHAAPHYHESTKSVLNRLARAIGHLQKVRKMVEEGEDCSKVLIQLSAVRSALASTSRIILKDHVEHCLVDAIERGDMEMVQELNKAIDQLIK